MNTLKQIYDNWPFNWYITIYLFSMLGAYLCVRRFKHITPQEVRQHLREWVYDTIILIPVLNTFFSIVYIHDRIKWIVFRIFYVKAKNQHNE